MNPMHKEEKRRLSKTISHALRHAPHLYELELDDHGWTPVDHLIDGLHHHRKAWRTVDLETIEEIVKTDSKGRYELDLKTSKIRALYGHSTTSKLIKEAATPPEILFHGTSPATAKLIMEQGLRPMSRQFVHHSVDTATAKEVGHRKDGKPVLLHVHAHKAHLAGITFYKGNALIWLSDPVPPEFISLAP